MAGNLKVSSARSNCDLAELSIALVAGLGLALTAIYLCAVPLAGHLAASRDFVSYWATGKQLLHHANPYDRDAIAALEHTAGLDARAVLIMRNPPWMLPLVWPLGFLPLRLAIVLWSLLLLGCLLVSVGIVRALYASPSNDLHWLGVAFTPALICLIMGQTALLALLGLALFLRDHRARPFAAGAALWLCALKPHLFLPWAVALAAWILYARAWKVLAGAAAALAATTAAAFLLAPHAWIDYANIMRSPAIENEFIPCLADALRKWITPQWPWTRYLPVTCACGWALAYFWRRRAQWDWRTDGGLLMLVSLVFAPYCWFYDQCLAIPALLGAAYSTRSRNLLTALAGLVFLADLELCVVKVISPLWLWTAPVWLAWYLVASGRSAAATGSRPLPAQPSASTLSL